MPVAIQQSPEKCCTILVHYSFLWIKSARKQVVSGEKSPSCDGLKVSTATQFQVIAPTRDATFSGKYNSNDQTL
ncbi:hypothetical protein FDW89_19730 [Citrobacter sp. wls830]|nr:hypothetical protein FDW89_19730 [Citrobacter sp. wls830]TKV10331.1 hypothetical protein FDX04_21780 [Citrobacter sp. wls615]